ncbi:hypothetical protein [Desulfosporosinus sp. OT]|uniref:hypothetical protein n=1 Tax=Desulfosporosinus sp. OT TaxID=913865 RepID=UPI000223A4DB|nr:hypothetical protein [Desulfosporosinus sp. OT]EGW37077.1 hypothetical protein DOT_4977 [Desulfosporosinus sp. OT]
MIKNVLREELDRLQRMEKVYREKIAMLPKGSIQYKYINGRKYPYLFVREGKQVKSQYLKLDEKALSEFQFQIEQRRKYEKVLIDINKDYKIISKAIH